MAASDTSGLSVTQRAALHPIKAPLTYLAAERTLLMWARTGAALIGALINGWAAHRCWRFHRRYIRGESSTGKGVIAAVNSGHARGRPGHQPDHLSRAG